ncbi:MAG TPA: c-type cytochrome [Vicinamibacterales bacterium]|nr:c-type cytochrome [Vicinamibacterales bacterium]
MLVRLVKLVVVLLAAVGLVSVAGAIWFASGGISARPSPSAFETAVARSLRSSAIPRDARRRSNPLARTDAVVREGMAHFADHCAVCHGNNGSGDTTFGSGLYPRPPDLRLEATQELTDGELFYIIENGVKLTGMPAFGDGTDEGAHGTWGLVHFIRHLPKISEEELREMEMLNPRPPEEWRQMEEERKFLEGEGEAPKPAPKPHIHKHGDR